MKRIRILVGVVVIGLTTALPYAVSAAEKQEGQTVGRTNKAQEEIPRQRDSKLPNTKLGAATVTLLYKPPLGLGSPAGLIAGGTRGLSLSRCGFPTGSVAGRSRGTKACLSDDSGDRNTTLTLSVLTPADHIGLTVHEQPSIYWYLSAETNCRIDLTLTDEQTIEPLLELILSPPIKPGVQRIGLADHKIHLAPGVQYHWSVALVPDPEHRSKDIIAAGEIKRIDATEMLQTKLAQANKMEVAAVYAEAGLWYDALTTISDLIAEVPQNPVLRMQRAALLEQVRLPEVAEYEKRLSTGRGS